MKNNFIEAEDGRYGEFGGCYLPEGLMAPIHELETGYRRLIKDNDFRHTYEILLSEYVGRPTPLTDVVRFSAAIDGPRIFLKREDLLHTGAHKINNAIGQCLLAKMLGKTRVIAENRRRATWCCYCHSLCLFWFEMCRLYGCCRYQTPTPQCTTHAFIRCRGCQR